MSLLKKFFDRSVIRFAAVGLLNTASGYLLYLLLVTFLPYPVAYTISYIIGIALSYVLNSLFVFGQRLQWGKAVQFPLVYVVQYVLGTLILALLVEVVGLDERLAPPLVIVVTLPVTYLLSRWIIVR